MGHRILVWFTGKKSLFEIGSAETSDRTRTIPSYESIIMIRVIHGPLPGLD